MAMTGKRIDNDDVALINTSGAYGMLKGEWYACTPNGLFAGLKNHTVTAHEGGTITVSPSILVRGRPEESWHGFLEKGVWREC